MLKNVGKPDKIIRTILGIVLIALIATKVVAGAVAIIFALLAAILILTSAFGFCPAYFIMKIKTLRG